MRKIDITTKAGWDIAAAIRGPDLSRKAESLKEVLTMRIRALVVGDDANNYGVGSARTGFGASGMMLRSRPLSRDLAGRYIHALEQLEGEVQAGAIHYLSHIQQAAIALGDRNLADLAIRSRSILFGDRIEPLTIETVIGLAGGLED